MESQYVAFGDWLLSFSIILSRFIHVVAYINTSLLLVIKWYPTKCIKHTFCPLIWVISSFWLLWTVLLWTLLCKFLFEHLSSTLWGKYPPVELLGHLVIQCFTSWRTASLFSTAAIPYCFTFPPATPKGSNFSASSPRLLLSVFFIRAILVDMKEYLIMENIHCIDV